MELTGAVREQGTDMEKYHVELSAVVHAMQRVIKMGEHECDALCFPGECLRTLWAAEADYNKTETALANRIRADLDG